MRFSPRLIDSGRSRLLVWPSWESESLDPAGRTEVDDEGAVVLPRHLLDRLGVKPLGEVLLYSRGGELVIEGLPAAGNCRSDA